MTFELILTLRHHTDDVKAVDFIPGHGLVTCSRDGQLILWRLDIFNQEQRSLTDTTNMEIIFQIPKLYLNCLAISRSPEGSIFVLFGGSDGVVRVTDIDSQQTSTLEKAHQANVCSISVNPVNNDEFATTSWDNSCQLWSLQSRSSLYTVVTKDKPVWCTAYNYNGTWLAIGSADQSIDCCSRDDRGCLILKFTHFDAHTDCVRSIVFVSNSAVLLSAGNDYNIKMWKISDDKNYLDLLFTFTRHINILFTMSLMSGKLASAGEDKSILISTIDTSDYKPFTISHLETIRTPAETCWDLKWITDETIAVSLSDGSVRIYSCNSDICKKYVTEESLKECDNELAAVKLNKFDIGNITVSELPTKIDLLESVGCFPSEVRYCRDMANRNICRFEWHKERWRQLGTMEPLTQKKHKHNGQEYDYVFTISTESNDSNKMFLPYNVSEDPRLAAERFVMEYKLGMSYVDEIIAFIKQNVEEPIDFDVPKASDKCNYIPCSQYARFTRSIDAERMSIKLEELNIAQSDERGRLTPAEIKCLQKLVKDPRVNSDIMSDFNSTVLKVIQYWEADSMFPVLDVVRYLLVSNCASVYKNYMKQILDEDEIRDRLRMLITVDGYNHRSTLVLLRLICNLVDDSITTIDPVFNWSNVSVDNLIHLLQTNAKEEHLLLNTRATSDMIFVKLDD